MWAPDVGLLKHLMMDETEAVYSYFACWHIYGTLSIIRNTLSTSEFCAALGSKIIQ